MGWARKRGCITTRSFTIWASIHRCASRRDRPRSEEHTSELQSRLHLVCRLLLEKKKKLHPRNHNLVAPLVSCISDEVRTSIIILVSSVPPTTNVLRVLAGARYAVSPLSRYAAS